MEQQNEITNKKETKKRSRDVYQGLHNSVQTFGAIGLFQAINGNIVLRGREGERDHIFRLEDAVEKYNDTIALVHRYALNGVRGWDTLKDIADAFKAYIKEAVKQREKMNLPIPESAKTFVEYSDTKKN